MEKFEVHSKQFKVLFIENSIFINEPNGFSGDVCPFSMFLKVNPLDDLFNYPSNIR
jgi:hypothetical protein